MHKKIRTQIYTFHIHFIVLSAQTEKCKKQKNVG